MGDIANYINVSSCIVIHSFPAMKRFLYVLIALVCAVALGEPFVLVEDGRPVSAIVISRWNDHATATGAMQFRDYVLAFRVMTAADIINIIIV